MGAGGSGKSTLCYAVNGVVPNVIRGEFSGRVTVEGRDVAQSRVADLAQLVGLVLQNFESQIFCPTVELEMAFGMENLCFDRQDISERISRMLTIVGLEQLRYVAPTRLSGGQKQRLAIASVLATAPKVLVMDEPTTDMDPVGRRNVLTTIEKLRNTGTTSILAEHRTDTALTADQIWLLDNGRLVASGRPADVLTNVALLKLCAVQPPQFIDLLGHLDCPTGIYTAEEMVRIIRRRYSVDSRAMSSTNYKSVPVGRDHPVLEANKLTHVFAGASEPALHEVTLSLHAGEFVGIIGVNGSGKSTLAKHFVRLLEPTSGHVTVAGQPVAKYTRSELSKHIGFVFQNPDLQLFAANVEDEIAFGCRQLGYSEDWIQAQVPAVLRTVGLLGFQERDPVQLAKGARQRVAIASALITRPKVLMLDEPTKGMDYPTQMRVMDLLADLHAQGHTIVFITHQLELVAERAQRVIVLDHGQVVADGPTRQVFADEDRLRMAGLEIPALVQLSNRLGLHAMGVKPMAREIMSL